MEGFIAKGACFNTPNNTVGVKIGNITTTSGVVQISSFPPFLKNDCLSVTATAAVAETKQIVKIGGSVVPTIVALQKYQIRIGNTGPRVEGAQGQMKAYGYTAPAALTGTAAIDRHNAYVSLAYKINSDPSNKCAAQVIQTVPQTTNSVAYVVGEVITGTTSGAVGVILAGTTATLTVNVTNGGQFVSGEAATGSIAGVTTTVGTVVVGVGLWIADDGAYWDIEGLNWGANTVTPTIGFLATQVVITTAAVYAQGQGADILKMMYAQEKTSENRSAGVHWLNAGELPVSGQVYTRYDLIIRPAASQNALADSLGRQEYRYVVYAYTSAADYADFNTDILAAHV